MLAGLLIGGYKVTIEADRQPLDRLHLPVVTIVAEHDRTRLTGRGVGGDEEKALLGALRDVRAQADALTKLALTPKELR